MPGDKVFIDDPAAARVLDFANATYALLLRLLVQSFGRVDERAGAMLGAAITLMHVVGEVGEALATMPASAARPSTNAGMTFTMLRGVEPLAAGPVEVQLLGELFDELADAAAVAAQALPRLGGCERKIRTAREGLMS